MISRLMRFRNAVPTNLEYVAGGSFTSIYTSMWRLGRINTDGTADSFSPSFNSTVLAIAIQSDGKIVCGGLFTDACSAARNSVARINTNGTLDSSFDIGTGFNGRLRTVAVQSDGKILCGGGFESYNGTTRYSMARLNTGGTLDSSFDTGGGFDNDVYAIVIQSDGKIVCSGVFSSFDGIINNRIVRLNTDGTRDSSFTIGTGFNGTVNAIAIQSDGKIVCGGAFTSYNGTASYRIARLNTDGTLDSSFAIGTGFNNAVNAVTIQSDGKIVCGGAFTSYNGTAINRIARLNTDGTLDSSFTTGSGFNFTVSAIAVQSDGKILCGGGFASYNGTASSRIARLNTDGTLDSSFAIGTGFSGGTVNAIAIQSDGKIVCGGNYGSYNATTNNRITRITSAGVSDSSFIIGTGFDAQVNAIAIQSDNKIVCGGAFTSYNGTAINRIARLNTDGTLDSSFTIGTGFNNTVNAVTIQSDGKLLIGGNFTAYNGSTRTCLARLNTDGTLDSSLFDAPATFNAAVNAILVTDKLSTSNHMFYGGSFANYAVWFNENTLLQYFGLNGSVNAIAFKYQNATASTLVFGGTFTAVGAYLANRIAYMTVDMDSGIVYLNSSFVTGTGFDNTVNAIAIQSDGKIVCGGAFTSYNGTAINRIARLNTDGTLDNSFTVGTGFLSTVYAVAIQPDGKILVGGMSLGYNGFSVNQLLRLNADGTFDRFPLRGPSASVLAIGLTS